MPVFISVDPERDTVEQVAEYVKGDSVILHELHFLYLMLVICCGILIVVFFFFYRISSKVDWINW